MNYKNIYDSVSNLEIKSLLDTIILASDQYYNHGTSQYSDAEFDSLKAKLLKLLSLEDLPVGFPTQSDNGFDKVKHNTKMLSLKNAYSTEDVDSFLNKVNSLPIFAELKIDGVSISVRYEDHKLKQAVTRGDGNIGDDVTANFLAIEGFPKELPKNAPSNLEVRGEIYITTENFNKLDKAFKTARNLVSGTLRLLDAKIVAERKLSVLIYNAVNSLDIANTQEELLNKLTSWGFPTNTAHSKLLNNIEEIEEYYNNIESIRDNIPYDIDGIVYKVNDLNKQDGTLDSGTAPKWAIARKFIAKSAETTLNGIDWQVGKTGVLTPVARIEPVVIGGVTISNVNLYNVSEILALELNIGDTVVVERSADVIPRIIGVVDTVESDVYTVISNCPSCNSKLNFNGSILRCENSANCKDQIKASLIHLASKEGFAIKGLGEKAMKQLIDANLIFGSVDIFKLDKQELLKLSGWGENSVNKLLDNIEKSKTISLDKFICSLNIFKLGKNKAKILADHAGSFDNLCKILDDAVENPMNNELIELKGFNDLISSILNYWSANKDIVENLVNECDINIF